MFGLICWYSRLVINLVSSWMGMKNSEYRFVVVFMIILVVFLVNILLSGLNMVVVKIVLIEFK